MKTVCTLLICLVVVAVGCATNDVNPLAAKPRTGYVDFYADDARGLCWEIRRLGADEGKEKILFEEFKPRTNGVIRLAFAPGDYCFGISFLDRAIIEAGVANVVVEDGKVTPVRAVLVETGTTITEKREIGVGSTFYGRTGRSTKLRATEGATFRIQTEAGEPVPYRPKGQPRVYRLRSIQRCKRRKIVVRG